MKNNKEQGFVKIRIVGGYSVKKSIKKTKEERINPKIWDWGYLNLKPILNEVNCFSREVKRNGLKKILDLGCGTKPYKKLFSFTDQYVGFDVEGVDEADFVGVNWVLPFKDDKFDVLMSTQVLEHTAKLDETVQEIKRVVKDGGMIFVSVPMVFPEHEIPHDYHRFTRYGLRNLFKDFEIVKIVPLNGYMETLIGLWNNLLHYIPGSGYFLFPVFMINNLTAMSLDGMVCMFTRIFKKNKIIEDIYNDYYMGLPGNYSVVLKNKK